MFKVPTSKYLETLSENSEIFYKKVEEIDGLQFSIYNYRLASYLDFVDEQNLEIRGIVSIDSQIYPSLHKIFNQGENPLVLKELQGNNLEITIKEDGSLITGIYVNDKVYFKSKTSFDSFHSNFATKFASENIKFLVEDLYKSNLIPFFELVSPDNFIVVQYLNTDLILLRIRNILTGEYLFYEELEKIARNYNISYIKKLRENDIDRNTTDIEGWVIWSQIQHPLEFRKIKTKWYLERNQLLSDDNNLRTDKILELILDEKIDDILQSLPQDSEKGKEILDTVKILNHFIATQTKFIVEIIHNEFIDRKLIAQKYKDFFTFYPLMKCITHYQNFKSIDEEIIMKYLIEFLKKEIKKGLLYSKDLIKRIKEF